MNQRRCYELFEKTDEETLLGGIVRKIVSESRSRTKLEFVHSLSLQILVLRDESIFWWICTFSLT